MKPFDYYNDESNIKCEHCFIIDEKDRYDETHFYCALIANRKLFLNSCTREDAKKCIIIKTVYGQEK